MKTVLTVKAIVSLSLVGVTALAYGAPSSSISTINGIDTVTAPYVFGNEPTITIAGYALDTATKDAGTVTAVTVYNSTSKKTYTVPVLRRTANPSALTSYSVSEVRAGLPTSLLSSGFIAVSSAYALPPGSYTVQSVTMKMQGTDASVAIAPQRVGQFTIPDGRIDADVTLTSPSGTTYQLGLTRGGSGAMAGKLTLSGYPSLRNGDYVVSAVGRDAYGNASSTSSMTVRYRRNVATFTASSPLADNFPGSQTLVTLTDPLTNAAIPSVTLMGKASVSAGGQVGSASLVGAELDAAPGIETDVVIPSRSGRHAMFGAARGSAKTISVWVDRPDAPDVKVDISSWDPDASIQLKATNPTLAVQVDAVQVTATTVGSAHCNQIIGIANGATMPKGTFEPPVCAIRYNSLPAGVIIDPSATRNLTGYLAQEGDQNIDYDTGVLWTDTAGVSSFYKAKNHTLPISAISPQEPIISFTPIDKLTGLAQASVGKYLTYTGQNIAGRIAVQGKYPGMAVSIAPAGGTVKTLTSSASTVSDYIRTDIGEVWGTQDFVITSWFTRYPTSKFTKTMTFTAVSQNPVVVISNGTFLSTTDASINGSIGIYQGSAGFAYDAAKVGTWSVQLYEVGNTGTKTPLGEPVTGFGSNGTFSVALGLLPPGHKNVIAVGTADNSSRGVGNQVIQSTQATVTIADGSPITGHIQVPQLNGPVPFSPSLSIILDQQRVSDIGTVTWQSSSDGITYNPVTGASTSLRPQLTDSGFAWFKATITNRFNPTAVTELDPVETQAFAVPKISITGDTATIVGYGATLNVTSSIPADFTWSISKSANDPSPSVISDTDTITVTPTVLSNIMIKVVASEKGAPSGNPTRNATASAMVVVSAAKLQKPLITGPSYVETGRTYAFKATATPLFSQGLKTTLVQMGHWVMPGGSTVDTDTVSYTVLDGDKSLRYEVWVDGVENTKVATDFAFRTWVYAWPTWQMTTRVIDNKVPATIMFSLVAGGSGIQGMGGERPNYDWQLPSSFQVLSKSGSSATVQVNEPGSFQMTGMVSDSRGNVSTVESDTVEIAPAPDLVPALVLQSGDRWNRAPNKLYARVNLVSVPKNDIVGSTTFKLDDVEVTTGKSSIAYIDVPSAGTHEVKAIVSSVGGKVGSDTQLITLGMGDAPVCALKSYGDGISNLTLTAACTVQQGSIVSYRWTSNGQPLSMSGNLVSFARADLDKGVSTATVTAVTDKGQTSTATWNHP